MARKINSRLKINGKLYAKTPLYFGCNNTNSDTDLPLAVNGKGQLYVPGTNIAGWLRNWMERLIDEDNLTAKEIENLWGSRKFSDRVNNQTHASFIIVQDGLISPSNIIPEIRNGVGIDRNWGSAAQKQKYDREIIPNGSSISLEFIVERKEAADNRDWEKQKYLVAELLKALENEELRFGGGKTRGKGKVKLNDLQIQQQDLLTAVGMIKTLKNGGQFIKLENLSSWQRSINKPAQLKIKIYWQPLTPVMVKSEAEGVAVDILPLVSGVSGSLTLVLPGSSLKGIMRSQAERIVRTICDSPCPTKNDFLNQIQVNLVNTLFGSAAQIKNNLQQGYQGALALDDCYAKIPISPEIWREISSASSSIALRESLEKANMNKLQQVFHVAIDRWTGGAANHALYSVLEPMVISWQPVEMTLDLARLRRKNDLGNNFEQNYLARVALIFLILRDLMNQRIPIGFGTNRGMGDILVEKIEFKGIGNLEELQSLNNLTLNKSDLSEIDSSLLEKLTQEWQKWSEM